MNAKMIWCTVFIFVFLGLMLFNKKIRCFILFKDLIFIFYDYRTKKISIFDLLCFFVFPIGISILIVVGYDYYFSIDISNTLLTIFSILFTLLFGIMSLLTATLNSKDDLKKKISTEAFTAVSYAMLTSLLSLIIMILYLIFYERISVENHMPLYQILTAIIIFLTINMIMLFMLVIKRSYVTSKNNN